MQVMTCVRHHRQNNKYDGRGDKIKEGWDAQSQE
jgi:hypothetical protein